MITLILLLACIPVDGPKILGADSAASGVLPGIPADAVLGFAPSPGVRRLFGLQALRRVAARYGLAAPQQREICFERRTAPLDPVRLERAMRSALNEPDAEISIADFSRYPAPPGEIVFRREDLRPSYGHSGSLVVWRGYVVYDASKRFTVWARVRVTAPVTRIVAHSPIAPGEILQAAQLRAQTSRGFPEAGAPVALADVIGKRARRSIPAGGTVELRFLEVAPEIRKGQTVLVRVRRGAASLALPATAQADAQIGQPVMLRNQQTGKTFRGRVEGRDRVVIEQ
jgi:flagella basal body P-ring formation protein FlgA